MSERKANSTIERIILFAVFIIFAVMIVVFAFGDKLFFSGSKDTASVTSFDYVTSSKAQTLDASSEAQTKLVNINDADLDELMTLSGIGQKKAQAIIDYRKTNGRFNSCEEITNVNGIGQAIYENIKDEITVE